MVLWSKFVLGRLRIAKTYAYNRDSYAVVSCRGRFFESTPLPITSHTFINVQKAQFYAV